MLNTKHGPSKMMGISLYFLLTSRYHYLFILTLLSKAVSKLFPISWAEHKVPVVYQLIFLPGILFLIYLTYSLYVRKRWAILTSLTFLYIGVLVSIIFAVSETIHGKNGAYIAYSFFFVVYGGINCLCIRYLHKNLAD